jgi:hypothetical protein
VAARNPQEFHHTAVGAGRFGPVPKSTLLPCKAQKMPRPAALRQGPLVDHMPCHDDSSIGLPKSG